MVGDSFDAAIPYQYYSCAPLCSASINHHHMIHDSTDKPYPESAGFQDVDTSIEAAESTPAQRLRGQVLECFKKHGDLSPDMCAELLGLSILSIRPRFTELKLKGAIERTGAKATNSSGKRANVWRLVRGQLNLPLETPV